MALTGLAGNDSSRSNIEIDSVTMGDFQINLYLFLGVLEAALLLLMLALVFILRNRSLVRQLRRLQRTLTRMKTVPAPITFEQYLREEVIRNQELIESAAATRDDAGARAAELMEIRQQFLTGEIEARGLEDKPLEFQRKLVAGLTELVARLGAQAEAALETATVEVDTGPQSDASTPSPQHPDTHELEFNRLKDVINNQQDVITALRRELAAQEAGVDALDVILQRLDEFEQQGTGLQECLDILDKAHEYLRRARSGVWAASVTVDPADTENSGTA